MTTPDQYDEIYRTVYAPRYEWSQEDQEDADYYNARYDERMRQEVRAKKSREDAIAVRRRELRK